MIDLNDRGFICLTTGIGDVTKDTVFYFKQYGSIVHATFSGGNVKYGELTGLLNNKGVLEFAFNYSNSDFNFQFGIGTFTPERLQNKIRLHGKCSLAEDIEIYKNSILIEECSLQHPNKISEHFLLRFSLLKNI